MIAGIDFGSRTAGTTVIAWYQDAVTPIRFNHSLPGSDADNLILELLEMTEGRHQIFIDAPLSLPLAYKSDKEGDDFFFRNSDRELRAMSPMFLGGLTARAIALSKKIEQEGHIITEVYPSGFAKTLNLEELGYKKAIKNISTVTRFLTEKFNLKLNVNQIDDWHHVDALLCVIIGIRKTRNEAKAFGIEEEGLIWI